MIKSFLVVSNYKILCLSNVLLTHVTINWNIFSYGEVKDVKNGKWFGRAHLDIVLIFVHVTQLTM